MSPADFHIDLHASEYLVVLKRLHQALAPDTYLEIGTRSGDSLRLASCPSLAIDPAFAISSDVIGKKSICHFYQQPSDRFFRNTDVGALMGGLIDFAFLDGMHLCEFLLRDFMNVERWSRPNSLVTIHDCLPSDKYMACRFEGDHEARTRSVSPGWWTGDVWKAIWALKEYRPDLRILAIDSPPTGLICITNLDPTSTVIASRYDEIVRSMMALGDDNQHLQDFIASLDIIKPRNIETFEDISKYFFF